MDKDQMRSLGVECLVEYGLTERVDADGKWSLLGDSSKVRYVGEQRELMVVVPKHVCAAGLRTHAILTAVRGGAPLQRN